MSGLLFLSLEDFIISKGMKGQLLSTFIKGFSLLLFYSEGCKYSREVLPIFRKLPSHINNCRFGIINIDKNMRVIEMSKQTIAPIDYVPYIALYINGKPYMSYKGPLDLEELKRFVFDISQNFIQKQINTANQTYQQKQVQQNNHISTTHNKDKALVTHKKDFSYGIPLYGDSDDVSYLVFDTKVGYKISEDKLNKNIYKKKI